MKHLNHKIATLILITFLACCTQLAATSLNDKTPVDFDFKTSSEKLEIELEHPGNRYLAIAVHFADNNVPEGSIRIKANKTIKVGKGTFCFDIDRELFVHDGVISLVDNMAPASGKWQLQVSATNLPVNGSLELVDLGPAPAIEYSDNTGLIKIKKPGVAAINAYARTEHPDFANSEGVFRGSLTSDGDILIPAPVGLYRLGHESGMVSSIEAQFIPVHAGKITLIENWPQIPAEGFALNQTEASGSVPVMEKELKIRSTRLIDNETVGVRFATPNWRGKITNSDLEIQEGGNPGLVLSAGSIADPLHLVILLDSSGSMKKDMKTALESVEKFIKQLPEETIVELIDFDTKPHEIEAKNRNELLKSVKKIKADGATCLNDSVMLGLKKSETRSRPAILLFTDGFDANYNDTAPGSKTKPDEMFKTVSAAQTPIFTIGFGNKPDEVTLRRLATLSGGRYSAANQSNLSQVFEQMASILGSEHEMVYRRPGIRGNSDAPVISIVLDVSGSMNASPAEEGCDYRLEKAKAILRNLINNLPEGAIAQLTVYNLSINVVQVFTGDKMQLLSSLAPVSAGGGTATFETLEVAFKMLKEVPSDRKYMLFITDAGLEIEEEDAEKAALLGSIKDNGIQMTWIGMVEEKEKAPFDVAARLCNGHAVVSTDFTAVEKAIERLSQAICVSAVNDDRIPVKLTLSRRQEDGKMLTMSAAEKFKLPPPPVTDKASVNGLKLTISDMPKTLDRYSVDLNRELYGNSKVREETLITQRFPVAVVGNNKAMQLTVVEAIQMSSFRGFNLPCVALKLKLQNTLPEQDVVVLENNQMHPANMVGDAAKPVKTIKAIPPYLIPDLRIHLLAKFNDEPARPLSELSFLVEDPLVTPDDTSLQLNPSETLEGYLVFQMPETNELKKISLSYYDTNYGNIELSIVGDMQTSANTNTDSSSIKLEKQPEGTLSESVGIKLTGYSDQKIMNAEDNTNTGLTLRQYEFQVVSAAQTILDFAPAERMSLLLPTRFGHLVCQPSPRNQILPMGWYQPTLFVPGANNKLRQAYVFPQKLAERVKGTLRIDIADNEILLPAGDSGIKADSPIVTAKGDDITLAINSWQLINDNLLLDITLHDEKSGEGTQIKADDICQLQIGDESLSCTSETPDYVFSFLESIDIADGQQRRGLITIMLEGREITAETRLVSKIFDLNLALDKKRSTKIDDYMLCSADNFTGGNSEILSEIMEATNKLWQQRRAEGWKKKGNVQTKTIAATNKDNTKATASANRLPAPTLDSQSKSVWQSMLRLGETEFLDALRKIRCLPAPVNTRYPVYSPEIVILQGWGTQSDLFNMASLYYSANGKIIEELPGSATLNDKGKEALLKSTGWNSEIECLPVLVSNDKQLVFPFCQNYEQIADLFNDCNNEAVEGLNEETVSIDISLQVKPKQKDQTAQMADMGGILGGNDSEEISELLPILQLNGIRYDLLSRAPIDVIYLSNGQTLSAVAESAEGKMTNEAEPLNIGEYEVIGESIRINFGDERLEFERKIDRNTSIADTFRTLALCLPDLPASAAISLSESFSAGKGEEVPNSISVAKWLTRSKIYKFLALHCEAEHEAAVQTGVKIGRPGRNMRAIIVTLNRNSNNLDLKMDLRQINPQAQGNAQAIRAFNYYMGFANAIAEEQATGGHGLISRWSCASQQINLIGPDEIGALVEILGKNEKISETTRNRLMASAERGEAIMFPTYAPEIDGKLLLSWMTFDPETYAMNSIIETGEHGAGVEYNINQMIEDANKVGIGFLAGTESSIWAVTAFKLKYDDMRKVIIAAKKLCLQIAQHLSDLGSMPQLKMGDASLGSGGFSGSVGNANLNVGFGDLSSAKFSEFFKKPTIGFSFSYKDGFELAVKNYFGD
ncbi:MAG: VWA domain-containing protein [Candidatus Riflebacteria bacterium]|nr:VWA domain-containing protein [Candidatus Riflebacteria bacterium]